MISSFCREKFRSMVLTQLLASLMSYVVLQIDDVIIGQLINQQAVGAVGLVAPYNNLMVFVAAFVSGGAISCILSESGRLHKYRAMVYFTNGLVMAAAAGVLIMLAGVLLKDMFIGFIGVNTAAYEYVSEYYSRFVFATLLYPSFMYLQQVVYIEGDELLFILSFLVEMGVNTISSVLLAHRLGIAGIALGSVIGNICGILVLLLHFIFRKSSLCLNFKTSRNKVKNIVQNGMASSCPLLFAAVFSLLLNRYFATHYRQFDLPVLTVVNNIVEFAAVLSCVGAAASPFIAMYSGENNVPQLQSILDQSKKGTLFFGGIATVLIILFAPLIVRLFGIVSSAQIKSAVTAIRIVPLGFMMTAYIYVVLAYHTTAGSLGFAGYLSCLTELAMPALLAFPCAAFFGMNGLWVGIMLTPFASALFATVPFRIFGSSWSRYFNMCNTTDMPEVYSYGLELTEESVAELNNKVEALLEEHKVCKRTCNYVELLIEEIYLLVIEMNRGRSLSAECTVRLDDDLLLVMKDNGIVFDVTDADIPVSSLRSFTLSCIMKHQAEKINMTTLCCNRNAFRFPINDE